MIRRPPRSTHCISSAASDVYKRQEYMGSKRHLTSINGGNPPKSSTQRLGACTRPGRASEGGRGGTIAGPGAELQDFADRADHFKPEIQRHRHCALCRGYLRLPLA
eukprot:TRINITY_DN4080_c0_g1_i8.p3 TRINITY_DN4080_c0_g1~~TRINITY_DN4080_c0_g1_i8.p3  ORF type:complete len:106 (+),score=9.26 TRINITY_DN4080_c0_g1_i8:211-528(+)